MTSDDLLRAADTVCDAVRRHAASVAAASTDRVHAGPALVAALDEYGIAIANAGSEPPEGLADFEGWLDEDDGVEETDEEQDRRGHVALFVRADFAVVNAESLRASAIEQMQACCPVPPGEDPTGEVRRLADAVAHLFGHGRPVFDPPDVEQHGLQLTSEHIQAVPVDPDEDDLVIDPWTPLLRLADGNDQP